MCRSQRCSGEATGQHATRSLEPSIHETPLQNSARVQRSTTLQASRGGNHVPVPSGAQRRLPQARRQPELPRARSLAARRALRSRLLLPRARAGDLRRAARRRRCAHPPRAARGGRQPDSRRTSRGGGALRGRLRQRGPGCVQRQRRGGGDHAGRGAASRRGLDPDSPLRAGRQALRQGPTRTPRAAGLGGEDRPQRRRPGGTHPRLDRHGQHRCGAVPPRAPPRHALHRLRPLRRSGPGGRAGGHPDRSGQRLPGIRLPQRELPPVPRDPPPRQPGASRADENERLSHQHRAGADRRPGGADRGASRTATSPARGSTSSSRSRRTPEDPLLSLDNVILAPHALCWTNQLFSGSGAADIRAVLAVMAGRAPPGVVNRDVLERPGWQARLAGYAQKFGVS